MREKERDGGEKETDPAATTRHSFTPPPLVIMAATGPSPAASTSSAKSTAPTQESGEPVHQNRGIIYLPTTSLVGPTKTLLCSTKESNQLQADEVA